MLPLTSTQRIPEYVITGAHLSLSVDSFGLWCSKRDETDNACFFFFFFLKAGEKYVFSFFLSFWKQEENNAIENYRSKVLWFPSNFLIQGETSSFLNFFFSTNKVMSREDAPWHQAKAWRSITFMSCEVSSVARLCCEDEVEGSCSSWCFMK